MTARNAPGEDDDLYSTASVARFDPVEGAWSEQTPLPEPRSSHDAIVCGHELYVVGGWNLQGAADGAWHETAWVADLRTSPLAWQPLPSPGHVRRACAAATFAGKVAMLGGIDPEGTLRSACVYDPVARAWSVLPDLPAVAFGTAAIGVGERLYATVLDGRLVAWDGAAAWQTIAQLETPRFFHRLVPAPESGHLLALGGAGRGGHVATIETIGIDPGADLEVREFVLKAPGRVANRQAVVVDDDVLYAFGGNRALDGDRFAAEQFADDVWRIDLATMTGARVGALPQGCQSMAALARGAPGGHLVLGGLGVVDGAVRSLASGFVWDPKRRRALPFSATLPAGRTQHAVVAHDERIWVLGGTDFTPDGDGGAATAADRAVLVCDPHAEAPAFVPSGIELPRARRSFGTAVLGSELYLIGGLGAGFASAGPCDVYDFATRSWREIEAPVAWVSPEVCTIAGRLYVACGGTMQGQRFTEDRALWSYEPAIGWRRIVAELPFRVRQVQMTSLRNRLLFYAANEAPGDCVVLRLLEPDPRVVVPAPAFHR